MNKNVCSWTEVTHFKELCWLSDSDVTLLHVTKIAFQIVCDFKTCNIYSWLKRWKLFLLTEFPIVNEKLLSGPLDSVSQLTIGKQVVFCWLENHKTWVQTNMTIKLHKNQYGKSRQANVKLHPHFSPHTTWKFLFQFTRWTLRFKLRLISTQTFTLR